MKIKHVIPGFFAAACLLAACTANVVQGAPGEVLPSASVPVANADGNLVIDTFGDGYTDNGNNALGLLHTGASNFGSVSAAHGLLRLTTRSTGASAATWTTTLSDTCLDAAGYEALSFVLDAPLGSAMAVRITTFGDGCTGGGAAQDVWIPFTAVSAAPQTIVLPLSRWGVSNLSRVESLTFTGFSSATTYGIGNIRLTGTMAAQSVAAPATGTTLELPDVNFGDGSGQGAAQWAYDDGSFAGELNIGEAPYDVASRAWQDMQTYVAPATAPFAATLAMTNRPYAVSNPTGSGTLPTGDGDIFKLRSLQTFGLGTYTWRVYTPLNVDSVGGERNTTAAWIICESCREAVPPEIDIECGYADAGAVQDNTRTRAHATAAQTICYTTVQDGTVSGIDAVPMALQGDAWHTMQMKLADDGNGFIKLAVSIDARAVAWPSAVSGDPNIYDLGGMYKTSVPFNAMVSMEHYGWMGSQNAQSYNTAYFDWFNFLQ